jgi:hypothetical protein
MSPKGIQVPMGLRNISKLRLIIKETMKKSSRMTIEKKAIAVCKGVVKLNLVK